MCYTTYLYLHQYNNKNDDINGVNLKTSNYIIFEFDNYKQNTHSFTPPTYPCFSPQTPKKQEKAISGKPYFSSQQPVEKGFSQPKQERFRITRRLMATVRQLMAGRTVVVGTGTAVIAIRSVLISNQNGRNDQRGRSQLQLGRS